MKVPLMPKATALWLVENTSLTFSQIADFSQLHVLEVQAIADGEAAQGLKAFDPLLNGQITEQNLQECMSDPAKNLKLIEPSMEEKKRSSGRKYMPLSKTQRTSRRYCLVIETSS